MTVEEAADHEFLAHELGMKFLRPLSQQSKNFCFLVIFFVFFYRAYLASLAHSAIIDAKNVTVDYATTQNRLVLYCSH